MLGKTTDFFFLYVCIHWKPPLWMNSASAKGAGLQKKSANTESWQNDMWLRGSHQRAWKAGTYYSALFFFCVCMYHWSLSHPDSGWKG